MRSRYSSALNEMRMAFKSQDDIDVGLVFAPKESICNLLRLTHSASPARQPPRVEFTFTDLTYEQKRRFFGHESKVESQTNANALLNVWSLGDGHSKARRCSLKPDLIARPRSVREPNIVL